MELLSKANPVNANTRSSIRLYELVLENGRSASPFVWRSRYALAHKGICFESVPVGFTDIPRVFGGRFETVPVIQEGEMMLGESWDIAEYLDRAFPDRPKLFASPGENAAARLFDSWFTQTVTLGVFGIYALDAHDAARREDRSYFRHSREGFLEGITLEAFTSDRATRLPKVREALQPLREHLARFPFLGGSAPGYADYIALGMFQWVVSVSTLPLLAHDDNILRGWLDRGFDLYEGLGRDSRMRPLFDG
ncbi:MAG TPA: glutathione S-transferase N-terminal domain-containing protein [Steroidobacteraceae bacterium]|nr:glutathione S-transferase N-terminal domain-containing protein [Steroidobacteraceae bacterium]